MLSHYLLEYEKWIQNIIGICNLFMIVLAQGTISVKFGEIDAVTSDPTDEENLD